jgi:hypothetical protein
MEKTLGAAQQIYREVERLTARCRHCYGEFFLNGFTALRSLTVITLP